MLEIGKLYICEEYFLLLYPDWETAAAAASEAGGAPPLIGLIGLVNLFSMQSLYAKKNIPLLILNNREKYVEVLAGDRKGWIIFNDYLNIKEIP